jgi:hypothetical protein
MRRQQPDPRPSLGRRADHPPDRRWRRIRVPPGCENGEGRGEGEDVITHTGQTAGE